MQGQTETVNSLGRFLVLIFNSCEGMKRTFIFFLVIH